VSLTGPDARPSRGCAALRAAVRYSAKSLAYSALQVSMRPFAHRLYLSRSVTERASSVASLSGAGRRNAHSGTKAERYDRLTRPPLRMRWSERASQSNRPLGGR
jgi:hypothetical protein